MFLREDEIEELRETYGEYSDEALKEEIIELIHSRNYKKNSWTQTVEDIIFRCDVFAEGQRSILINHLIYNKGE